MTFYEKASLTPLISMSETSSQVTFVVPFLSLKYNP